MAAFNSKGARTKRPLPIWVDAFQRDTQHLQADEVGALVLIMMAMWSRETCDLPDDDSRLARIARVSPRLWKSRIGPVIREFLTVDGTAVFYSQVRKEAAYAERQGQRQSDRKTGKKSSNYPESIDQDASADMSALGPQNHPTQQPNNPTYIPIADAIGGGAPARLPANDTKKRLWDRAKSYLGQNGISAKSAGPFVGKCVKEHGLERTEEIFRAAENTRPAEPIPWITAALTKSDQKAVFNDNFNRMLDERLGLARDGTDK